MAMSLLHSFGGSDAIRFSLLLNHMADDSKCGLSTNNSPLSLIPRVTCLQDSKSFQLIAQQLHFHFQPFHISAKNVMLNHSHYLLRFLTCNRQRN